MPEVSIVMTAYNRAALLKRTLESLARQAFKDYEVIVVEDGWDDGFTEGVAKDFGARYFCRRHRPETPYSNPAVPVNIGLRRAAGDIIILQNAECEHVSPDAIEALARPHRAEPRLAVFAAVMQMNPNGSEGHWYCHPQGSPRPFFFCGSMRREHFLHMQGMDEAFRGYGFEDDLAALKMRMMGIRFDFRADIRVNHNWHASAGFCFGLEETQRLFEQRIADFHAGMLPIESNLGREWGQLD